MSTESVLVSKDTRMKKRKDIVLTRSLNSRNENETRRSCVCPRRRFAPTRKFYQRVENRQRQHLFEIIFFFRRLLPSTSTGFCRSHKSLSNLSVNAEPLCETKDAGVVLSGSAAAVGTICGNNACKLLLLSIGTLNS